MRSNLMLVALPLGMFWALLFLSSFKPEFRRGLKTKSLAAWLMDGSGLLAQGWLIPLLQAYLLLPVFAALAPEWQDYLKLPWTAGFLMSFVAVDYLYYWNHRLLHSVKLWPWHRAHHGATAMDIFVASRNSLGTHLLICYVWVHSLALFSLQDDAGYIFGIALSAALDLWRHSSIRLPPRWSQRLGLCLVLPEHHAWHHAVLSRGHNFGANFNLWDKLHGTWQAPIETGFAVGDSAGRELQYIDLIAPIRN